MEIRKARLKDADEITKLWKRMMAYHKKNFSASREFAGLKPGADNIFKKFVIGNIRGRNGLVLVAEDKGRLVGYSLNFIKKNIKIFRIEKMGHMSDLYIDKKYRGTGLASGFRKLAMEWFKEKGLKYTTIHVTYHNKRALEIYRKWGYKEDHITMMGKI
jgi:GNAT superfamily N-acetyltransferase